MKHTFETERLYLKPIKTEHFAEIYPAYANKHVMKYIYDGQCITEEEDYLQRPNEYELRRYSRWVDFVAKQEGSIKAMPIVDVVKKLESYHSHVMNVGVGDKLCKTIDLFSSPGSVYLVNESENKLFNDYLELRESEAKGYVL